ncbi:Uncharacterised protein [Staphylococcus aureus]|nr:Uncharacterised protein [Staphylococcus aureus]
MFGPISIPSWSAGIESDGTTVILASLENSLATLVSTGNTILSPCFSNKSFAKSILSSSNNEIPISLPCAFKKV